MAYLLNAWYVAAAAAEVTQRPMHRVLLDEPVVLFRTKDGAPAALYDRCPHRFVPLSRGNVSGQAIQCGYHGLQFDRTGACIFNPHGDGAIPKAAVVRSYPAVERCGYVWIWPGEHASADPDLIPHEFRFLSDPDVYAVVAGYLHVQANYQLVVDNLLDLTHAPYLHPQFGVAGMSAEERLQATQSNLARDGNTVWARRSRHNSPPNDLSRRLFKVTADRVDTRSDMHWHPPSNLFFDLGLREPGTTHGIDLPAAHLITPETEFSSHYFFAQARNVFLDDNEVGRLQLEATEFAFRTQDEPMLEAQQACMGATANLLSLKPVLLGTDAPPMAARRILESLISQEQARAEPAGAKA